MKQNKQQWMRNLAHEKKMLSNLKLWMKVLILLSTINVAFSYWAINLHNTKGYAIAGIIGVVLAAVCVVLCGLVGLAYKKGKTHFEKMLKLVEV